MNHLLQVPSHHEHTDKHRANHADIWRADSGKKTWYLSSEHSVQQGCVKSHTHLVFKRMNANVWVLSHWNSVYIWFLVMANLHMCKVVGLLLVARSEIARTLCLPRGSKDVLCSLGFGCYRESSYDLGEKLNENTYFLKSLFRNRFSSRFENVSFLCIWSAVLGRSKSNSCLVAFEGAEYLKLCFSSTACISKNWKVKPAGAFKPAMGLSVQWRGV